MADRLLQYDACPSSDIFGMEKYARRRRYAFHLPYFDPVPSTLRNIDPPLGGALGSGGMAGRLLRDRVRDSIGIVDGTPTEAGVTHSRQEVNPSWS